MYWWMQLIGVIVFAIFNFLVVFLKKRPKTMNLVLKIIAIYFLIAKTAEYIYWQAGGYHYKWPIELSAIMYFVFPAAVLTNWKPLIQFSIFGATIAGFFYYVSMIAFPTPFVENNAPFFLTLAVLNHGLLYFCGANLLLHRRLDKSFFWQLTLILGIIVGYSYLIRWAVDSPEDIMIINIIEGRTMDSVVHMQKTAGYYTIYYGILTVLFFGIMFGFYKLNHWLNGDRRKKQ